MLNITVLCGSIRKDGNTELLAKAFAEGAAAKHKVTFISVADYDILPCTGCNACYHTEGNLCIHKDDMTNLYAILAESDLVVAASPVYFYGISARLKAVVDRLHVPSRSSYRIRRLGLLLTGAAVLPDLFDPILMQYDMIRRYFQLDSIGTVLVPGVRDPGDILKTDALERARTLGASIE